MLDPFVAAATVGVFPDFRAQLRCGCRISTAHGRQKQARQPDAVFGSEIHYVRLRDSVAIGTGDSCRLIVGQSPKCRMRIHAPAKEPAPRGKRTMRWIYGMSC